MPLWLQTDGQHWKQVLFCEHKAGGHASSCLRLYSKTITAADTFHDLWILIYNVHLSLLPFKTTYICVHKTIVYSMNIYNDECIRGSTITLVCCSTRLSTLKLWSPWTIWIGSHAFWATPCLILNWLAHVYYLLWLWCAHAVIANIFRMAIFSVFLLFCKWTSKM